MAARLVGSITHSADYVAAVVCEVGALAGIGIDIEQVIDTPTCTEICGEVVSAKERSRIPYPDCAEALNVLLTLIFSAKESYFKASFPLVERYFDFSSVEFLGIDMTARRITMRCVENLSDQLHVGFTFQVGYAFISNHSVMTMAMVADDSYKHQ